ncbi:serine/arginine-rich SC35-like splicing factor SCL33 isoform X2 [Miscanthus floridulus]|uniref:serine/arginine-rich SC35-like splicing factor SCL33 isoform X2 n=1 Tax=Miscanthus floridulus TaxID=154761 RepID=UPI00345B4032
MSAREPKGFGFIQYFDPEDASDAKYHMDGQMLLGREITVVFAEENRKKPSDMRARERMGGRGRSYDRRLHSRSPGYIDSPRGRSRSHSPSYSPAPKRKHYSRSPSPRPRERSVSRSPADSRSRSASPSVSRSRSRQRSLSVSE